MTFNGMQIMYVSLHALHLPHYSVFFFSNEKSKKRNKKIVGIFPKWNNRAQLFINYRVCIALNVVGKKVPSTQSDIVLTASRAKLAFCFRTNSISVSIDPILPPKAGGAWCSTYSADKQSSLTHRHTDANYRRNYGWMDLPVQIMIILRFSPIILSIFLLSSFILNWFEDNRRHRVCNGSKATHVSQCQRNTMTLCACWWFMHSIAVCRRRRLFAYCLFSAIQILNSNSLWIQIFFFPRAWAWAHGILFYYASCAHTVDTNNQTSNDPQCKLCECALVNDWIWIEYIVWLNLANLNH